ncbi:Olfactory receptor 7E24 [Sciurus carolinensis]|uniref:Olfactory receptor 7E24 n=1 Tax=Sciurus carolinensis TaxID=30640 RepID=A0AA41MWI6_SCICA|nr:Olfactory receptor 7E24 [Sciurus carolinensis]
MSLSEDPDLQPIFLGLFLFMYLVTVLGNLLIILAVSSDPHIHTPMYFFLSNPSLADIGFISTTVPKMLVNIQTHSRAMSYVGCLTQMSFFLIFGCMDDMLLTVMAYDRHVAICHPLQYPIIMNPRLWVFLVLVSLLIPSSGGKYKAFSTCGSHLSVVCLFYGTAIGVYLASAVSYSPRKITVFSLMYTVVTPMLNPFIYSLRNKDIKAALKKLWSRRT